MSDACHQYHPSHPSRATERARHGGPSPLRDPYDEPVRHRSLDSVPPPVLVALAVVSVQFGGAFAATLIPTVGAGGTVLLRLLFAGALLAVFVRPRPPRTREEWRALSLFGLVLGAMNLTFYASLAHLPIGVAVTIEFIGPLGLAVATSRRARDLAAAAVAAIGVVLISEALEAPLTTLPWTGLALAFTAGLCWAGYILASRRAGALFPGLDGIALAMVVALVAVTPFGIGSVPSWTWPVVGVGLAVAVMSSVVPYSLELVALRRMAPGVFGVLLSTEPAAAALGGLLVLGQRLSGTQLAGMALVVLASALVLGRGSATPAEV